MLVKFCLCVNENENAMTFNHSVVNNGKINQYKKTSFIAHVVMEFGT